MTRLQAALFRSLLIGSILAVVASLTITGITVVRAATENNVTSIRIDAIAARQIDTALQSCRQVWIEAGAHKQPEIIGKDCKTEVVQ